MTDDEQHVDLLAVFHFVVGGLTALFSCFFLVHVAVGILMVCCGPINPFAWLFIIFPAGLVLIGWTLAGVIVAAGLKLKRRASHTFCLAVAGIECILMPFGTVLGVFTIVVLTKESVKQMFAANRTSEAIVIPQSNC